MRPQEHRCVRRQIVVRLSDCPAKCDVSWTLSLRSRLRKSQQVPVRPAATLLVLHELVREGISFPVEVPVADRATQPSSPAAELLGEPGKEEQLRPGAADLRNRSERVAARVGVLRTRTRGESEEDRRLLRVPTSNRDRDDLVDSASASAAMHPSSTSAFSFVS